MIKRSIYSQIKMHLATPDVFTLITGPRQAGKTTLMELLRADLEKEGRKSMSLNIDITSHKPFFQTHDQLVQAIRLEIGTDGGYVFLDEIQRKEDAGLFLKGLYDMKLPYKFIISGSGSLELKERIHESLPGRKRLFQLSTISFEEFVNYKTASAFAESGEGLSKLAPFFSVHGEQTKSLLNEYLDFGGYPRVVLTETSKQKRVEIDDIYKSYIDRDIEQLLTVKKSDQFSNLVRMLAAQTGNLVNITELSNSLRLQQETVNHYLWYLENTFIVRKVTPFFKNVRSEITKSPIYYFVDIGLKNFSINQFGTATLLTPPQGLLFENFVFNMIYEYLQFTSATIHFWRTQDKAEIDFIINTGTQAIPVEVKYMTLQSPEITRSFKSFIARYNPKEAYIIHLGEYFQKTYGDTVVHFLPFYSIQMIIKDI